MDFKIVICTSSHRLLTIGKCSVVLVLYIRKLCSIQLIRHRRVFRNLNLENVIGFIHVANIVLPCSRDLKCVNIRYIILSCSGICLDNFAA